MTRFYRASHIVLTASCTPEHKKYAITHLNSWEVGCKLITKVGCKLITKCIELVSHLASVSVNCSSPSSASTNHSIHLNNRLHSPSVAPFSCPFFTYAIYPLQIRCWRFECAQTLIYHPVYLSFFALAVHLTYRYRFRHPVENIRPQTSIQKT